MDRSTDQTKTRSKSTIWRMLSGASMAIFVTTLLACGGGSSTAASGELTPGQFETMLKASPTYIALTKQLADDEATIKQHGTLLAGLPIPHKPGTSIVTTAAVMSGAASTEAINNPVVRTNTVAVDFGPCPDGGDYIGSAAPDPSGATVDFFKQCTGVTYGVNTSVTNSDGTHPISEAPVIWFVNANCDPSGGMIEFANDGSYNDRTLLGGVVFFSPVDGTTELQVAPTQEGQTQSNMTALSNFSAGVCNSGGASETHKGFPVIANATDTSGNTTGTGVPAAVNPYIL